MGTRVYMTHDMTQLNRLERLAVLSAIRERSFYVKVQLYGF